VWLLLAWCFEECFKDGPVLEKAFETVVKAVETHSLITPTASRGVD
jgi:hypothetical protein